jgi:hypothetical protein
LTLILSNVVPVAFQSVDPAQEIISLLCRTDGSIVKSNPVTASFSGTSRVNDVEVAFGNAETEIFVGEPIDVLLGFACISTVYAGEA